MEKAPFRPRTLWFEGPYTAVELSLAERTTPSGTELSSVELVYVQPTSCNVQRSRRVFRYSHKAIGQTAFYLACPVKTLGLREGAMLLLDQEEPASM